MSDSEYGYDDLARDFDAKGVELVSRKGGNYEKGDPAAVAMADQVRAHAHEVIDGDLNWILFIREDQEGYGDGIATTLGVSGALAMSKRDMIMFFKSIMDTLREYGTKMVSD